MLCFLKVQPSVLYLPLDPLAGFLGNLCKVLKEGWKEGSEGRERERGRRGREGEREREEDREGERRREGKRDTGGEREGYREKGREIDRQTERQTPLASLSLPKDRVSPPRDRWGGCGLCVGIHTTTVPLSCGLI